jgi:hypothetical protein
VPLIVGAAVFEGARWRDGPSLPSPHMPPWRREPP